MGSVVSCSFSWGVLRECSNQKLWCCTAFADFYLTVSLSLSLSLPFSLMDPHTCTQQWIRKKPHWSEVPEGSKPQKTTWRPLQDHQHARSETKPTRQAEEKRSTSTTRNLGCAAMPAYIVVLYCLTKNLPDISVVTLLRSSKPSPFPRLRCTSTSRPEKTSKGSKAKETIVHALSECSVPLELDYCKIL